MALIQDWACRMVVLGQEKVLTICQDLLILRVLYTVADLFYPGVIVRANTF
jgi:hypothetical protein